MSVSTASPPDKKTLRKVWSAGFIGTTVEYYEFFIYGTAAALVFPVIFFPELGAAAAVTMSFATFGVAFIARPLGGIVFGHIGDRVGRKTTLVMTLLLMGFATLMIGLLPDGRSIGVIAPILLVTLRFLQGLAVGGEWASAALFVGEYAPKGKRARYALGPALGTVTGLALSTITFLITGYTMTDETFQDWGWRVPFILSVILVGLGLWIRLSLADTPVFRAAEEKAAQSKKKDRLPISQLFSEQPKQVFIGAGVAVMWLGFFYIGSVYLTNYGTDILGFTRNEMLTSNLIGVFVCFLGILIGGLLADRTGRKPLIVSFSIAAAIWSFIMFPLANTGELIFMTIAVSVSLFIVGMTVGPVTALMPEIFNTRYRATGTGVAFNLGSVVGGAVPPIIAAPIFASAGSLGLSVMMAAIALISVVAGLAFRETRGRAMASDIGSSADELHPIK